MYSLNYFIKVGLKQLSSNREAELDLSDELPNKYGSKDDDINSARIINGLTILADEIMQHGGGSRVRLSTERDSTSQRLIIAWDGDALPDELVARINDSYTAGAEYLCMPQENRPKIAAYWLSYVNGTVRIENYDNAPYKVRNVVEIPLK